MLDKQTIIDTLKDRNLLAVSRGSGVSYPTVLKIAKGNFDCIMWGPVQKVSDYLEHKECKDAK